MPVLRTPALQLSVRAALAAGLAYGVSSLFSSDDEVYALVAAVIVTDLSPTSTRQLAWQRLAGTLVGAGAGATMTYGMAAGPLAIAAGILIAMLLTFVLRLDGAAKIAGYVAGIVLVHAGDPWAYAALRALDTTIGIIAALLVSFVPKLLERSKPP
jgi:uncharacterized membrane protein YgaE (UPF0421/DUF939 family)